ncbi:hypothetical protein H2C43_07160 [Corynebacterium glutamicum]|uniref:Uncharacterized protein n=1 Tax=Corynebacterium glutamicum (strain ATCC 13032 / DSM 20300 / JCM 1318 / BCRC 11384 / CCUG 27702 / LMG 3730 / NBRC 12168 / NCIMB 10025 / NRRL B-2784 / 534) TaxID=196627 RepID=Q8NPE8_CORGL|nr:hypothetical protein [Corynebacterium glutamicum]AUI01345.1 hypothetical protein CYL77_09425 [Corynebacterium glutamicum]AUI04993.1 hypothetical protein C0I99_13120 [Corynebacterium glutamicum]MBA4571786.1 hypothetical protein [Corynebacterium glutamicum]MBA4574721.1 hypothetical protein [Corynebacterium glutamicum]MBA4577650.1 hypothetical protein [Corynebacterium glutamicum]
MTTRTVSTSAPHVTVNINTAHNKTRTVTNGARKTNAERGKSCISFRVGPELFDEFKATCIDNDISMTKAFEKELRTWVDEHNAGATKKRNTHRTYVQAPVGTVATSSIPGLGLFTVFKKSSDQMWYDLESSPLIAQEPMSNMDMHRNGSFELHL